MSSTSKMSSFKPISASRAPKRRQVASKKVAPIPETVCASCMPMGETQIIAMLLVAVFGLAGVLTTAVATLAQQHTQLTAQSSLINALNIPSK